MHAHEPEEAHSTVDDGKAHIAVGGGEQRLEHLDDALSEANAERSTEHLVKGPENRNGDGEGDEVLERLRDVGRHLLRQADGDVAQQTYVLP